jgi:hypothetical protein
VSTYIAAIEIETILVTGVVCAFTGTLTGVAAIWRKHIVLAAAAFLTPTIALVLFVLEAGVLHLGPGRAAVPFCIIFIINQIVTTLVILVYMHLLSGPANRPVSQLTIQTLLVSVMAFAAFLSLARVLLHRQHDWRMRIALGLLGITVVGLVTVVYSAYGAHRPRKATGRGVLQLIVYE